MLADEVVSFNPGYGNPLFRSTGLLTGRYSESRRARGKIVLAGA